MPVWRKNLRLSSIYRKALTYAQTRKSGILRDRFGIPGFQVIFITKSRSRLERMKEAASNALEVRTTFLFLFATPEEFRCRSTRGDGCDIMVVIRCTYSVPHT